MIDITLLGTAALLPLPERALTALTLRCCGHTILFDCGEGTQTAAHKAGVSLMKADMIALTHFHGDHILGIPGLLQTMSSLNRTEKLIITGPEGLEENMAPILKLAGRTPYPIELITLPPDGLRMNALEKGWPPEAVLTAFKTEHRVPSQGYVFTLGRVGRFQPEKARALGVPMHQWGLLQKGRCVQVGGSTILPEQVLGKPRKGLKFVFSGDTEACGSLVRAAEQADLLVSEATYGEDEQAGLAAEYGHMTFSQAASVAAKARAKTLWLTHYSPRIGDPGAYLPNAAAVFENTLCGTDGMSSVLRFED